MSFQMEVKQAMDAGVALADHVHARCTAMGLYEFLADDNLYFYEGWLEYTTDERSSYGYQNEGDWAFCVLLYCMAEVPEEKNEEANSLIQRLLPYLASDLINMIRENNREVPQEEEEIREWGNEEENYGEF